MSKNLACVNVRVEKDVKKGASEILDELGVSLTTAVNVYLRKIIKSRGIPFMLKMEVNGNDLDLSDIDEEWI
jgi:DNA-damage-inducible protein J